MSTFREAYEYSRLSALWDIFLQLATDGRPLGIHLVVTGDRPNSVPASLLASIQRRLVLRLSSEDDYISLDVPKDVLAPGLAAGPRPAGRARGPARRARRRLQPGPAGTRSAQAQRGHAAPGHAEGAADRTAPRTGGPGHPPRRQPGPARHRCGRRNAPAGRDHGQGPAAPRRPAGCGAHRCPGHHGIRAAPVQPGHRADLHRLPPVRRRVTEGLEPVTGGDSRRRGGH